MRKTLVLTCALAVGGMAAMPAFADCQADIKAAEEAVAKVTDAKQKAEVQMHIDAAKSELAKSNEKACSKHVTEANAAMKPAMKNP